MSYTDGKILKIVIFLGLLGYLLHSEYSDNGYISLEAIGTYLLLAFVAYVLCSLYGLTLRLLHNYLLAFLATFGILMWVVSYSEDHAWLGNDTAFCIIFIGLGSLALIRDTIILKKAFFPPKDSEQQTSVAPSETAPTTLQDDLKSDPRSVLYFSNVLEEKSGRKPTYEEILAYIDTLEDIPEDEQA